MFVNSIVNVVLTNIGDHYDSVSLPMMMIIDLHVDYHNFYHHHYHHHHYHHNNHHIIDYHHYIDDYDYDYLLGEKKQKEKGLEKTFLG